MERLELLMEILQLVVDKQIKDDELNDILITCADLDTLKEVKSALVDEC